MLSLGPTSMAVPEADVPLSADTPPDESEPFEVETLRSCPLCGSDDWSDWAQASDLLMRRSSRSFRYARCSACGVLFQQERPTEATVSYFYEGDYGPYRKRKPNNSRRPFHKLGLRIAEHVSGEQKARRAVARRRNTQLAKPCAVLLDFGCGGGKYLGACKRRFGCRTIGMDFNPSLFPALRANGHEVLDVSDASWMSLADCTVDLVVMSHVLEHVYNPRSVLSQVHRVLKPGGLLDLGLPNPNGVSATRYRSHWFSLDSPRHIILYGPEIAAKLVAEAGFAETELVGEPVTKDALRSMAREAADEAGAIQGNGWVALNIALDMRRAAYAGNYDRFHLFARKRR